MAKDVSSKAASNTNNTSPPISDQQKVPPLRIVLNTSGNQKSSSTAVAVTTNPQQQQQQQTQQELKRERAQDARVDGAIKTGGRVRIKLGTNKQVSNKSSASSEISDKSSADDASKSKGTINERQDNTFKEEINANHGHLRRITRRSQRSIQTVSNEDEESISSMTSTDENQNTTNNNNSDNNSGQDTTTVVSSQPNATSSAQTTNSSTNNSSSTTNNAETPRRYKRRKGEISESQLSELDGLFGFQNYKLPVQNSFELYKNIRKQVDKKLKNLHIIHPKTPHGFRDYMLARGAYLLDGNKLGNGTNLFMNEDGGLHPAPMGKYHAMHRNSRVVYSVPNRAKVPPGLPINSPLYNLFIEQEKDRYRMRMQHIKEREKLTLAAEQEIVRVYNQASMAAANQIEPFSVCTMLKHQEIYNYIDSDGVTIQSSEDDQLDQIKQEGVRTRRRQHETISPAPTRKNSNTENTPQTSDANQKDTIKSPEPATSIDESQREMTDQRRESSKDATTKDKIVSEDSLANSAQNEDDKEKVISDTSNIDLGDRSSSAESQDNKVDKVGGESTSGKVQVDVKIEPSEQGELEEEGESVSKFKEKKDATQEPPDNDKTSKTELMDSSGVPRNKEQTEGSTKTSCKDETANEDGKQSKENVGTIAEQDQLKSQKPSEPTDGAVASETVAGAVDNNDRVVPMELETEPNSGPAQDAELVLTDDDRKAYNKEIFLSQLQDIDDKWDKIRSEMLIRHRNEAESLNAVQRLEWEWKTKETGACDVRATPIIDNTLVPKLNVYTQDY